MKQANRQGKKNERKRMVFDFMIIQIKIDYDLQAKTMEKEIKID